MFNPSRDQVRQFFCSAWKKHQERLPLVGAEVTAADIALRHLSNKTNSAAEQNTTAKHGTDFVVKTQAGLQRARSAV